MCFLIKLQRFFMSLQSQDSVVCCTVVKSDFLPSVSAVAGALSTQNYYQIHQKHTAEKQMAKRVEEEGEDLRRNESNSSQQSASLVPPSHCLEITFAVCKYRSICCGKKKRFGERASHCACLDKKQVQIFSFFQSNCMKFFGWPTANQTGYVI